MESLLGAISSGMVFLIAGIILLGCIAAAIVVRKRGQSSSSAPPSLFGSEGGPLSTSSSPTTSTAEEPEERQAFIEDIPNVARTCVELSQSHFNVTLDYSEASLKLVDEIIEQNFEVGHDPLPTTILTFGAYVGETIRKILGGNWLDEDGEIVLQDVGGKAKIFPFNKVRKRFVNGPEDSIAFFYHALRSTIEKS